MQVLDRQPLLLPQPVAEDMRTRALAFLDLYEYLAALAYHSGVCMYKLRPKWHYFAHCVDELVRFPENPRRQELNAAEDHIGRVKVVARNCHKRTVSLRVAQRRALFLSGRCFAWRVKKSITKRRVL